MSEEILSQDTKTESDYLPIGKSAPDKLIKFIKSNNIANDLDKDTLAKIARCCQDGFNEDKTSMSEWLLACEKIIDVAKLKGGPKTTPLPKSSNIKFPVITQAAYQFASRMYPEFVKDGRIVKAKTMGADITGVKQERAERVSQFMSYQLLMQDDEWELHFDRLLNFLPLFGFLVKKTYFDPVTLQNKSELCEIHDIVVHKDIKSLERAPRISHILHYYPNDLIQNARAGIFLQENVDEILKLYSDMDVVLNNQISLIEQHCFYDLDEDGYSEPYIVTFDERTGLIVRIVARYGLDDVSLNGDTILRIRAQQSFTAFHFLPNPDGSFLSIGFGSLLLHMNESINTILNQLIDAGSLANLQGGFMDSKISLQRGVNPAQQGEWKSVNVSGAGRNIRDMVVPFAYKEPSTVLFQLLGTLVEASREVSSSTQVLNGTAGMENVKATTVVSLIDQGLKVFNAIQRRLYRSLKGEFQKLFNLNKVYLDPIEYTTLTDDPKANAIIDFQSDDLDILPIADPNMASDAQRLAKVQALIQIKDDPALNKQEIFRRYFEALNIPNPDALIAPPNKTPPPDMIKIQADINIASAQIKQKDHELRLREKELFMKAAQTQASILVAESQALLNMATAQSTEHRSSLDDTYAQLDILKTHIDKVLHNKELDNNYELQSKSMAEPADDTAPAAEATEQEEGMPGPTEPGDGLQQGV